ncbi:MAG: class I SAM-dependent methyltransferase [Alphaproteobacteria bacterium]
MFHARDYEHGVPGEWLVVRCPRCNLMFLSPMPADEELASFYPSNYSAYQSGSPLAWLFRSVYRLDARRIRRLIGERGRILDVGCGNGDALLQIGPYGKWDLCGVELNGAAVEKARSAGVSVQQGDLASCNFPDASMRLIRMGHVIEHVPRPADTLRRAYALLEPGGVLYGETPSTDCLDFRLFGKYWGALHVPRHLFFFDGRNLRRALEQAGFVDVSIAPRLRTVGWSCGVQNYLADRAGLRIPEAGRVRWYLLLIICFLPLTLLQSLSGKTATVAFTARKPGGVGRR